MVRPRFFNLPPEKQEEILDAAAAEFSTNPYKDASLNRIIEAAGLSKGAMYYYFDDKEDLYLTVLQRVQESFMEALGTLGECHTADEYWQEVEVLFIRGGRMKMERPEMIAIGISFLKAAAAGELSVPPATLFHGMLEWMEELVKKGQQVSAVRTDIPSDLLVAMVYGVGETIDLWAARNIQDMTDIDWKKAIDFYIGMFRRLMQPGDDEGFFWKVPERTVDDDEGT